MRSIAVMNQKGGVGKTTTSVNLSAALARMGHRVCLADLDPQAHASLHLGVTPDYSGFTTYDVLTSNVRWEETRKEVAEGLQVVPSHIDLAAAEVELAGVVGRELILRDKLAEDQEKFDFLLVDCPPSLGVLTLNALAAVEEVFLPLQPHFLALHGLSKLLDTILLVQKRLNPRLKLTGVVFCMCEASTRLANEVIQDVETFFREHKKADQVWSGVRMFGSKIRRNIRLAEAPSFGQSIFEYAANSNGAEDYAALAAEVAESPSKRQPVREGAATNDSLAAVA